MRILIVEDERRLGALIERGLKEEGYAVDLVATAEDAQHIINEVAFDLVLLDIMLPDGDGFSICAALRKAGNWTPVLLLTARDGVSDRVKGLDLGADDYLVKPFNFDELLARMRALLRRGAAPRPSVLTAGRLTLDPAMRSVKVGDEPVDLTPLEFSLLEFLMRNPGRVFGRTEIREHVWNETFEGDSNVIDVYVRYLRQKIDRRFGFVLIETVRGVGYRVRTDAAEVTHQDEAHASLHLPPRNRIGDLGLTADGRFSRSSRRDHRR